MGEALWIAALAAPAALEIWAIKHKPSYTLSAVLRRTFRVSTTVGRIIFWVALAALALWLAHHIVFD